MSRTLNIVGLIFTIAGAALLFFYSLPKKQIGNVLLIGETALIWDPTPGERSVPNEEWQSAMTPFIRKSVFLNRTGFALVSIGSLLQLFAAW